MATYVLLLNWTEQGIRNAKETLARADAAAGLVEKLGGKMKEVYWTLGPYDVVAIVEAPDDETATAFAARHRLAGQRSDDHAAGF